MFSLFSRNQRSGLLWNATDHLVQVARLGPPDRRPLVIEAFAEFTPAGGDEPLAQWLKRTFPEQRAGFLSAFCGFHPADRVIIRETINTKRLAEPGFLPSLVAEQAKLASVKDWHLAALHPVDGEIMTVNSPSRPGLVMGLPYAAVRDAQNRLRKLGVRPRRLELGSISLLGALARHIRDTAYPHAVVACEIGLGQTRVYFLAKDGVHTPATLPHGLLSIMESAMKELGAPGIGAARDALFAPTEELRAHNRRLVRMLTRHLKPAIDYFEMQTGQPIGALFCAHLPSKLGWLEEALCAAVDLEFLVPDLGAWLPTVGLRLAEGVVPPPRSWFQPLSLVAQLAPAAAAANA